ncbi:hypothetical protein EDD17DRAFT_1516724 [Pisolithus thermaeus]|nr:hypothetical protein EDD17DRAFT_1516724 [Pisolithus thermaeus]
MRIIAGPYCSYIGHIIAAYSGNVNLQYDSQSPHLEVSKLLLETHVPDHVHSHVHSLSTKHDAGMHVHLPKPVDETLPSDTAIVCQGVYKGTEATIEWMNSSGNQVWIYVKEVPDSSMQGGSSSMQGDTDTAPTQHPDQQAGYQMVPVNIHDIQVHRAACMISFTKEKGFNVCAGDDIEVVRGKWFWSGGTVQAVHFDQDVWVIHGEKKGYQGTLRSIGQGVSHIALQGQLVQLRNDHIATLTGLVLDGTLLPLGTVQALQHQSFIPMVCSITPPPSAPSPVVEGSSVVTSDAWTITAEDLSSTTPVYGKIPWLFQSSFCDFSHLLLGFTINDHYWPYNNTSMGKHIVQTRCPNLFSSNSGIVPLSHHKKSVVCGQIVAQDGTVMSFKEVCLAFAA